MAAPALAGVLKKVATYIVTDKKLLKTVGGIALGILFIILMPLIAIFSIASGEITIDTNYINEHLIQNLTQEEKDKFQNIEDTMNGIGSKMSEAGFNEDRVKEAQVIYTLALYDFSEQETFVDDLVSCFSDVQTDEQLIYAVNLKFGADILLDDFQSVMSSIRTSEQEVSSQQGNTS